MRLEESERTGRNDVDLVCGADEVDFSGLLLAFSLSPLSLPLTL